MSKEHTIFQFVFQKKQYMHEIKHYILLLLLPLVMCIALFISVYYVTMDQLLQRAELTANHFYVQSTSMMREMQIVSDAILRDDLFIHSVNSTDSDDVNAMELCDMLRDSVGESPYISHVYLVSYSLNKIYSDMGYFNYQSLSLILQGMGASADELTAEAESSTLELHILNGSDFAPYCFVPITSKDGESIGTLIVTLKMTEFLRIFVSLDAEICSVFNDEFYISSVFQMSTLSDFDWSNERAVSELVGTPVTCFYLEADGLTYLVGIAQSEYNKPLQVIIWCFCIYAVMILVVGYIYLYKVSQKHYLQLTSLIDALPAGYTSSPTEDIYSDIRKSLLEFRDEIKDVQMIVQGKNLHNMLYGHCSDITTERLESAGIPTTAARYYVVTFFIDDISSFLPPTVSDASSEADAYELIRVLLRSAMANLTSNKIDFASCPHPDGLIAVFTPISDDNFRENVIQITDDAIKLINSSYNITLRATISRCVVDQNNLSDAFKEALKLRNFAMSINSDVTLLSQENIQNSGGGALLNGDFIRKEQTLINTILAGKYSVVPSMTASILSEHVSKLRKDYSSVQNRLTSVANTLSEGVLAANLSGMDVSEATYKLREADSVSKLNEVTEQVYGRMAELITSSADANDIVSRACQYIHDHVDDQNLNVSAICDFVGVSSQRLTRMFQAKFDLAVAEYVNTYRVGKIKELLSDNRLTIAQIATKVGYNNTDTLTRNFRKLEGITPSEYRKLLP